MEVIEMTELEAFWLVIFCIGLGGFAALCGVDVSKKEEKNKQQLKQ